MASIDLRRAGGCWRGLARCAFVAIVLAGATAVHADGPVLAGGGRQIRDCMVEFGFADGLYAPVRRYVRRSVKCTDGDSCDQDGTVNDRCVLSLAPCVNVSDPALPLCVPTDVVELSVRHRRRGEDDAARAVETASESIPFPSSIETCASPIEVSVPVRVGRNRKRLGRTRIRTVATDSAGRRDRDWLWLLCEPGSDRLAVRHATPPNRGFRAFSTVSFGSLRPQIGAQHEDDRNSARHARDHTGPAERASSLRSYRKQSTAGAPSRG